MLKVGVKNLDNERYLFRLIRQGGAEQVSSFVERLQNQLMKCDFVDPDSQMKDQIIEKGTSSELRQMAFENHMSLSQLILTGKTLEIAERKYRRDSSKSRDKKECYRCGRTDHLSKDPKCKAIKAKCMVCRNVGHFAVKCKISKKQQSAKDIDDSQRKRSLTEYYDEKLSGDNKRQKPVANYHFEDKMPLRIKDVSSIASTYPMPSDNVNGQFVASWRR